MSAPVCTWQALAAGNPIYMPIKRLFEALAFIPPKELDLAADTEDVVTIGKAIGGGIPCGAYGVTSAVAQRIADAASTGADIVDVGGVGGTLSGNALSLAAMRATLGPDMILVTPGVRPAGAAAGDQKRGMTPALAIAHCPWCGAGLLPPA